MRFTVGPLLFVLYFGCGAATLTTSGPGTPTPEPVEVVSTVQYPERPGVAADRLSLDVYHRSGAPAALRPVVVYVHGGAWVVGDKANQIADKVNLFRGQDYVFVSTNYRLSPVNGGGADRIKFPYHNLDVAAALRWVHDSIATYGGDPTKIALLGHSAGAHLVALTGTNPTFLAGEGLSPRDIAGVASVDTEGYDVVAKVEAGSEVYINAFGLDPEDHERASPLYALTEGQLTPNFFIAKRGSTRRLALADDFATALTGAGAAVQLVDGSIYTHAGINAAIGEAGEAVITPALLAFLEACFTE